LAELKAKEDYFEMEDDLKTYVHKKFGWVGPKGKEFYPIPTEGRANRRKRNHDNEAKIEKGNSSASQSVSKINLRNSLSKEAIVDDDSTKRLSVSKKRKAHASTVPVSATQHKSSEKGTNDRVAKAQMKNREADFDEIDEETTSGISTSNVKPKSSDTRISVGIPDEDYNADERNLSLKTKLENCSKSLCISNTSDDILFTGLDTSSHFSAAKDRIVSFLEKCISDNDDPKHSSVLNICGRPGTGKVGACSIMCAI
jgi:flagellar biosynthesis GTPase FlhF